MSIIMAKDAQRSIDEVLRQVKAAEVMMSTVKEAEKDRVGAQLKELDDRITVTQAKLDCSHTKGDKIF
ncbi:hypothetical protein ABZP36_021627 [Zizania latifolia]